MRISSKYSSKNVTNFASASLHTNVKELKPCVTAGCPLLGESEETVPDIDVFLSATVGLAVPETDRSALKEIYIRKNNKINDSTIKLLN